MICKICEIEFIKKVHNQLCCSEKCSKINKNDITKKFRQDYKEELKIDRKEYRLNHKEEIKEYHKKYDKERYQKNKEEILEYNKKYYQENKEEILEHDKIYRLNHKEEIKNCNKKYQQTSNGKKSHKKSNDKRKRDLDFIPLNEWFEGSNGHHINKTYVIYIPEELHRKFSGHSVKLNKK